MFTFSGYLWCRTKYIFACLVHALLRCFQFGYYFVFLVFKLLSLCVVVVFAHLNKFYSSFLFLRTAVALVDLFSFGHRSFRSSSKPSSGYFIIHCCFRMLLLLSTWIVFVVFLICLFLPWLCCP